MASRRHGEVAERIAFLTLAHVLVRQLRWQGAAGQRGCKARLESNRESLQEEARQGCNGHEAATHVRQESCTCDAEARWLCVWCLLSPT